MTIFAPRSALRACAAALLASACAGPAAAQVVAGRVIDAATGEGVPTAQVVVTAPGHRSQTITSSDGRFSVAVPGGGSYRVQAARTGYAAARTRAISVGAQDTVRVDVRLQPSAVRLRGVTATARRRRLGVRGVFTPVGSSDSPPPVAARASTGTRSIVARGAFVAPTACYQLSGVADRLGSVVTLYVQARPSGEGCLALPGAFDYKATVRGLPPGSYTFRVLHVFRDAVRKPEMPLDTTLTVP